MTTRSELSRSFRISALALMACTALAAIGVPPAAQATTLAPATFEEYIFSELGDALGTSSLAPEAISVNATTGSSAVDAGVTMSASPIPKVSVAANIENAQTDLSGTVIYQIRLVAADGESLLGQEVSVLFSFTGLIDVSDSVGVQEVNLGYSVIVDGGSSREGNLCFGGATGCSTASLSLELNDSFHLALPFFDSKISNTATISFFAAGLLTGGAFSAWIDPLPYVDPALEIVRIEFSPGVVAVPEPGPLALLALGLLALIGVARKRISSS